MAKKKPAEPEFRDVSLRGFPAAVLEELRAMLATQRNKQYVSASEAIHWAAMNWHAHVKVKQERTK